jgi:hypothetical protein
MHMQRVARALADIVGGIADRPERARNTLQVTLAGIAEQDAPWRTLE